jgi:hypothetical protein
VHLEDHVPSSVDPIPERLDETTQATRPDWADST